MESWMCPVTGKIDRVETTEKRRETQKKRNNDGGGRDANT